MYWRYWLYEIVLEKVLCAKKVQYHNKRGRKLATVVCDGWCDRNLYVRSLFTGRPRKNHYITALDNSPLSSDILTGSCNFKHEYGYQIAPSEPVRQQFHFLADGICPGYPLLAKHISNWQNVPDICYTKDHESIGKDIENSFGVSQSRFNIQRREKTMVT